jgi:hypothetical protein
MNCLVRPPMFGLKEFMLSWLESSILERALNICSRAVLHAGASREVLRLDVTAQADGRRYTAVLFMF